MRPTSQIDIGTLLPGAMPVPELVAEDRELLPFGPWTYDWLRRHLGAEYSPSVSEGGGPMAVPLSLLGRHSLIVGPSGEGKSMLLHLLGRGMMAAGFSLAVISPKPDLPDGLLAVAASGLPLGAISRIDARPGSCSTPGFNPLAAALPLLQRVSDLVSVLHSLYQSSWGPRMNDVLTNCLVVAAAHGLSIREAVDILVREETLADLLSRPLRQKPPAAYVEAVRFFRHEFLAWSRSERAAAVAPVTNKLREVVRNDLLARLLCAPDDTLRLEDLWRRPRLVAVHLDEGEIGDDAARLLGALLCRQLIRTSMRTEGPVPVALLLDEAPHLERLVGEPLARMLEMGRSRGLSLHLACQHLAQLSPELRESALQNAAVQIAFRAPDPAGARSLGAVLAAGTENALVRATLSVAGRDRKTGIPSLSFWRCPIEGPDGYPLSADPAAWREAERRGLLSPDPLEPVESLARSAGIARLYVRSAGSPVPLRKAVLRLPAARYWVEGPSPLRLVVSFPTPRASGVEVWSEAEATKVMARVLMALPVQHAAVRLAGGQAGIVRIRDIQVPHVSPERWERFLRATASPRKRNGSRTAPRPQRRVVAADRRAATAAAPKADEPASSDGSIY